MHTVKKFLSLLTKNERKNAYLLLVMILIMALLDMIGVASILPFMAVLTNPEIVETNIILKKMFEISNTFGVENNQQFLFVLGSLVFGLLIISLLFKALTTYAQLRFVQMREYTISKRFLEGYLYQPYSWFLGRHSADIGKTILSEVGGVVGRGMKPLMEMIAKGMVTIALVILLIITDPKLALIVGFSLGAAYIIIYSLSLNYLSKIGEERLRSNQKRFTTVSEAFGAAKELKVGGLEQIYIDRFSDPAKTYARHQASAAVIGQLPRFALEAVAFGGILLVILYLMNQKGSFNSALPIISLYAFAGYRLLPALQSIYASFTRLTFIGPSLNALCDDIQNLKPSITNSDKGYVKLNKKISLKNIFYNYPNSSRTALKDITINIPAKTTVGLVGATGSGKTTTVDIILGLLEAQKGTLEIDDKIITKLNSRAWQRSIGYVPQHIYLSDDSIASNIAFGVKSVNIDQEAVKKASRIANLHEFVINELPEKYKTIVGERGVRLSGGQRQRIGIARALYHNPHVLILDEATSALDNETENIVMDAVNNLRKDITIILIAHRLNTVKNCDMIFKLDKGKIIEQGSFDDFYK
tara:strand:+ start:15132 stop:16889 length:1758 start_codon:yes stop_codon:yes gene_type:complete